MHDAARQHELDDVVEMLARHGAKSRHLTQPLAPRCASYASFLQGESQELLRKDVKRLRWWHDGFDVAVVPESQQAGRSQESVVGRCQEQTVPDRPGSAPGAAQPLQKGGDGCRRVDLDHAIEIADVDSQLQGARGDYDAIVALGERLLGTPALVQPQ